MSPLSIPRTASSHTTPPSLPMRSEEAQAAAERQSVTTHDTDNRFMVGHAILTAMCWWMLDFSWLAFSMSPNLSPFHVRSWALFGLSVFGLPIALVVCTLGYIRYRDSQASIAAVSTFFVAMFALGCFNAFAMLIAIGAG